MFRCLRHCELFCWLVNQFGRNMAAGEQWREKTPIHSCTHTCTAELDYLNNAKVCSYNDTGQWQMRSFNREGRKTASNTLWAVIDRCRRLAVRLNRLTVVALTITWCTSRGGAAQTNKHATGKDRQAGFNKSRMKASWRRCVTRWREWIRSSEEGSWFRSRRWRQYESVHNGRVLCPMGPGGGWGREGGSSTNTFSNTRLSMFLLATC